MRTTLSKPETAENERAKRLLLLRLTEKTDNVLRDYTRRKGDIALKITDAIINTDFKSIEVVPRNHAPNSGREVFLNTSVRLPEEVIAKVKSAVAYHQTLSKQHISLTAMIDAAIINYFKPRAAKGKKYVESDIGNSNQSKRRRR